MTLLRGEYAGFGWCPRSDSIAKIETIVPKKENADC